MRFAERGHLPLSVVEKSAPCNCGEATRPSSPYRPGLAAIVVAAVAFSLLVVDRSRHPSADKPGASSSSLLVVTWGPSLCKVDPANPGCKSGHVGKLGRTLILHGLWPQPRTEQFCGVPKGGRRTGP